MTSSSYLVYIKDSVGCAKSYSAFVDQPASVTFSVVLTNPTCYNGSDGSIVVTATGGSGTGYQYSKDNGTTWQTGNTFSNLSIDSYLIKVKDNNGCLSSGIASTLSKSAPNATISTTVVSCNGGSNGTITVSSGTGGSGSGYQSKLTGGTYANLPVTYTGKTAGSYTVYVKDGAGCEQTYTATVSQNSAVSISYATTGLTCSYSSDGVIRVNVPTGGVGPYQVKIDNGTYQTTLSARTYTGLSGGAHTIYAIDDNGCEVSTSATVSTPSAVTLSVGITYPTCYTGTTGSATITASGGAGSYQYSKDGGTTWQLSNTFSSLVSTSYDFRAKDGNGCISTISTQDLSVIVPHANISVTNPLCYGGNGTIAVFGGTNQGLYANTNFDSTWRLVTSGYNYTVAAGTYTVNIKNIDGCIKGYTYTLTAPSQVSVSSTSSSNPSCWNATDGSISVSGSGGTPPYQYAINKDYLGWGFNQTGTTFSDLGEGIYNIRIIDDNSCVAFMNPEIILYKTSPSATIAVTNPVCNAGTGTIVVSGGSGGTGSGYQAKNGSGGTYVNLPVTYSSLAIGSYTIYIKDSGGCERGYGTTISIPNAVTSTTSFTYPTCYNSTDGAIAITGGGGTPNASGYKYSIDGGAYTAFKTTHTFTGLTSASHSIIVLDNNSCYQQIIYDLTVSSPTANISSSSVSCYGGSDGSINVIGATLQGIECSIDGGTYYSIPHSFSDLASSNYTIRIKDYYGCVKAFTVTVGSATIQYAFIINITNTTTAGNDGSFEATSSGGNWPKTYRIYKDTTFPYTAYPTDNLITTFSNVTAGSYAQSVTELDCGYYWLQVTDANGCVSNTTQYEVTCPAVVTLYPVELRSGGIGGNSTYGSACYNYNNGAMMDVTIYTETGYFDDGYEAYTDSSGTTYYSGSGYFTDGINSGRITAGFIRLREGCTSGGIRNR